MIDIYDIEYDQGVSSCCGSPVYADIMICSDCKEHCETENNEET